MWQEFYQSLVTLPMHFKCGFLTIKQIVCTSKQSLMIDVVNKCKPCDCQSFNVYVDLGTKGLTIHKQALTWPIYEIIAINNLEFTFDGPVTVVQCKKITYTMPTTVAPTLSASDTTAPHTSASDIM